MTKKTKINKKTKIIIDAEFLRNLEFLILNANSQSLENTYSLKMLKKLINKIIRRI